MMVVSGKLSDIAGVQQLFPSLQPNVIKIFADNQLINLYLRFLSVAQEFMFHLCTRHIKVY